MEGRVAKGCGTLEKDLRKAAIYAGAGVPEYWVVDPNARTIIVHRRPGEGAYGEVVPFGPGESVGSTSIEGFAVSVGELLEPV